jgi:hypothetical protein
VKRQRAASAGSSRRWRKNQTLLQICAILKKKKGKVLNLAIRLCIVTVGKKGGLEQ